MRCFIVIFIFIGISTTNKNVNRLLHKVREILNEVNRKDHVNSHIDNQRNILNNIDIGKESPIYPEIISHSLENKQDEKNLLHQINKELSKDESNSKEDLNYILRCDGDRCGLRAPKHEDKDQNNMEVKKGAILILSPVKLDKIKNYKNVFSSSRPSIDRELLVGLQAPEHIPVIPNELARGYEKAKKIVISNLEKYVLGKETLRRKDVSLSQYQRLNTLKNEFLSKKVTRRRLKALIDDIMFGEGSSTKIFYKGNDDGNIHVPKWLYKKIYDSKQKETRMSRLPKRILVHGLNKSLVVNIGRRGNLRNFQNYGVPFELDIEGLGQVVV